MAAVVAASFWLAEEVVEIEEVEMSGAWLAGPCAISLQSEWLESKKAAWSLGSLRSKSSSQLLRLLLLLPLEIN